MLDAFLFAVDELPEDLIARYMTVRLQHAVTDMRRQYRMERQTGRDNDTNPKAIVNRPLFGGERLFQMFGCFFMGVQGFIEHLLCFLQRDISDGTVDALGVVPIGPLQRLPFKLAH